MTDLELHPDFAPAPTTLFQSPDPAQIVAQATRVADVIAPLIRDRQLAKRIGASEHVYLEGWTLAGTMLGVFPITVASGALFDANGVVYGYQATVEARTMAGAIVGRAEAECTRDENDKWANAPSFQLRSMAQCVPLRAQILTRRGWRHAWELETGEPVLAYDIEQDANRWVPLERVSVFDLGKPMVRLTSRSFDVTCTADHSWATLPSTSAGKRRLIPTNELPSSRKIVLAARGPEGRGDELSERDAAVIGWLMTDGTIRYDQGRLRAAIDQCEGENAEAIRKLLAGWLTSEKITHPDPEHLSPSGRPWGRRPVVRFNLSTKAIWSLMERAGIKDRTDVPALATRIGGAARRAMLDAMICADGWTRPNGRFAWGKQRQDAIDTFHVLCALEGIPLGRQGRAADGFPRWTQRKDRTVHAKWLKVEPASLQATWCPTTPLGTWIMRLDGQVTITGNTRASSKALRMPLGFVMKLAGYDTTPAEEMEAAAARGETVTGGKGVRPGWRDIAEQQRAHADLGELIDAHGLRKWVADWCDSKGYVRPLAKGQFNQLRRAIERELEDRAAQPSGPGPASAPPGDRPGSDPNASAADPGGGNDATQAGREPSASEAPTSPPSPASPGGGGGELFGAGEAGVGEGPTEPAPGSKGRRR